IAYVGDRLNIEEEDVEAVVSPTVEDRLFTMFDCLIGGDAGGALTILKNILSQKDSGTVQLLTPLTNRIRQMVYYKTLKAKGYADREISGPTGIKPNILWLYEKQTRAYSLQQLQDYLLLCIRMDYEFKSGQISEESALDSVIMALVNKKARLPV
ncbi:MAG: DNA polymerase III subunit delta, partial [Candidatus Spyradocola sp.]